MNSTVDVENCLNKLNIQYNHRVIQNHDFLSCLYKNVTFSISIQNSQILINKYLGIYNQEQIRRILIAGKSLKNKGYKVEIVDDNGEQHLGLSVGCYDSLENRRREYFMGICRFLQIIVCGTSAQSYLNVA